MDALVGGMGHGLSPVFWSPLSDFLATHPRIAWLIGHPLWAVGLGLAGLWLLAGLWSAIARLTERFWLTLVKAPFQAIAALLTGITGLIRGPHSPRAAAPNRLADIMTRLDALQEEQAALLQEMRTLLAETTAKSVRMEELPPEEKAQ